MAATREFYFDSSTGKNKIYTCEWAPETAPRAVLQISHGVLEHIGRYDAFARFFAANGFLVVGNDHLGHGRSAAAPEELGFFAEKDGWEHLVRDMRILTEMTQKNYGALPYFLFGHSMGSFLVRSYASRFGEDMDGFIFCGTAGKNPALPIAKMIAKREIKTKGLTAPSKLLDSLSFGSYNKAFRPNRTPFDWLSVDAENVDRYIADDNCGFVFTAAKT